MLFFKCGLAPPCRAESSMDALRTELSEQLACYRLELVGLEKQRPAVGSKNFCLTTVYNQSDSAPFWVRPEGPVEKASIVLDFLKRAETEGLDPANYEVDQIEVLFAARDPGSLAKLDTLLTFNLIKYMHDVSHGRLTTRYADPALFAEAGDINFKPRKSLKNALKAPNLARYLESLPPQHTHYTGLKNALKQYREIERGGGWPLVPAGPAIEPGDNDTRVPIFMRRLAISGDVDFSMPLAPLTNRYGTALEKAIKSFQARHGIEPDGIIGPKTMAALNVPVSDRIKQIIINMARWRWQEHDLGERYILVNIAHFELKAFEAGCEIFSFPVIVGEFEKQTPVFSDRIKTIVINPYWKVPPSIARNEELLKLRKDPGCLSGRHIRIFSDWSDNATEIDPTTVDWHAVSWVRMGQYCLRQDPGPWNALGRLKFVFPNKYKVYLHDTPTQNLFKRRKRDFSHGCIRVSDPVKLAAFALSRQRGEDWTPERINKAVTENDRIGIGLSKPLPIHITYQTAWFDRSQIVCFNHDVYGRDKKLLRALFSEGRPNKAVKKD